jgi:hypothetical protein
MNKNPYHIDEFFIDEESETGDNVNYWFTVTRND